MSWRTLIETDHLAAHLDDPQWRAVDCRFDLKDTAAGEHAYAAAHIPRAVYAHLDRDLSGEKTGSNGRHPLPDPQIAAETFGRLGIGATTQVVAYDADSAMFAARLWWILRWLGHDAVAVLNGGFAKWRAEGRVVAAGVETAAAATFIARQRPEMRASANDVAVRSVDPAWRLLDARAPDRFRGEVEPIDRTAGHIPGARNHFFETNLSEAGAFRSTADLEARLTASLAGVPPERTICYCGSGVTACQNLLALEHAGLRGARLYVGSWSEWSSDPARPIATGSD
jgi:thiosulfate/3-mercaptopyruvate sulfurtransferase